MSHSESSSSPEMVMIEIPAKQALLMHIQSLQDALAKRNERIEQLEARIEAGDESPLIAKARAQGFTAGWKACASRLSEIMNTAARHLQDIRREASDAYSDPAARLSSGGEG